MDVAGFKTRAGLSDGAFLNIARDLRLLNLTNIEGEVIFLSITAAPDEQEITKVITWQYQCKGCAQIFEKKESECPICGSELRFRPKSMKKI